MRSFFFLEICDDAIFFIQSTLIVVIGRYFHVTSYLRQTFIPFQDLAIYENLDIMPKRSPNFNRPRIADRSAGDGGEKGKGFVIRENLEQPS